MAATPDQASPAPPPSGGKLAANVMQFARALRAAGLPVGPGRVVDALQAVDAVGVGSRRDLYWTLHAVFVNRRDQWQIFDQCFHIFWRDPQILERMMSLMLPQLESDAIPPEGPEASRRVAEALGPEKAPGQGEADADAEEEIRLDAVMTWSDRELLQAKDFEQMSAEEIAAARREVQRLRLPIMQVPTRRFRRDPLGSRVDMRRTLRQSLRGGSATIDLARKQRIERHPPLVILCDISGSMDRYARMLLQFMHTVTTDRDRVFSFVFGTRLTNITRYLRHRDIDLALEKVGGVVRDWSGGTRIGHCLEEFNRVWSRRVLGQGAVVLLITDGLDRDAGAGLAVAMERLHKSCRRLIWLNPLLRFDAYAPISTGARAMIRHVDDFRSVHNLASLRDLTDVLSREGKRRAEGITEWIAAAQAGRA
ncbi:MAG TPA: VWA domain-containing protein [Geminicoccaceae bacterium]|nr:VWA domain-containing protein [Geminicoccus sp.]HMU52878.1 VWA domain-containing protein [Geminicoccaceae bacterium]